jgi:hypothetical protein
MKINRISIFNNLTIHHKSKSENTTGGIWSESDFEIDYLLFFYIEMDFHFLLIFVDKVNSVPFPVKIARVFDLEYFF